MATCAITSIAKHAFQICGGELYTYEGEWLKEGEAAGLQVRFN